MARFRYFQTLVMNKKQILNEAKKVLSTEIKGIKTISKSFNDEFYQVVKAIFETKGRTIITGIGKSGHIANKISATLTSTGTPSHFIHATEASHGDLGGITKKDVILAISNSGQSNELNGIINYSKRYNIPLLSISSNKKGNFISKINMELYIKNQLKLVQII